MPTAELTKPMPHDGEAERSILGAILLDNAALDQVAQTLNPSQFFHRHHRSIYEQMILLAETHVAIDLVTLTEQLHKSGHLDTSGGAAYLAQLMDGVPHVTNVQHYAAIVKEKALLRGLVRAAHTIGQDAMAAEDDAQIILDRAEQAFNDLAEGRSITELAALADVVDDNLPQLQALLTTKRAISGLETGYPQLDGVLCGLHPGNVIILAARPSIGKTALALNIAENAVARGRKVALFSLEMTRQEILQRLLASISKRDLRKLRSGGMTPEDWRELVVKLADMRQLPLYIDDANPTTVTEIAAKARYLKRRAGLELVIVDYLQLVSGSRGRFSNRNEEVGAISRGFKSMARSLNVPVIVLSQLTRASEREERRPQLSDLRESGAIEQDADVVLFIHRPKAFAVGESPAERNKTDLIVAKQRNGPTEVVGMAFLAPYTRFEELTPELMFEGA